MKRALLVIDVQNEYFDGKLPVTYPPETLKNILKAMDAAAKYGVSIIVVQHTSPQKNATTFVRKSEGWKLRPEVTSRPYHRLVERSGTMAQRQRHRYGCDLWVYDVDVL